MNTKTVCMLLVVVPMFAYAQKKTFTPRQLFDGELPEIIKHPPMIEGWADDEHYLETRIDSSGGEVLMSVNVQTGMATPYQTPGSMNRGKSKNSELPSVPGALNITLSPDGQFAAYTRDNNLFVLDIDTQKETALTSDGSETILNGYASWVYYEEILGRSSRYKAFWWSPDSRKIAFMRFDDSNVPLFPIYVADGVRGYLEQERYPKAGDVNPQVRIGMIDIASISSVPEGESGGAHDMSDSGHTVPHEQGLRTVWADFIATEDQYFGTPHWTPGNRLWVQWMNREQDSLRVYEVNIADGKKKLIHTEYQSTWITLDDDGRFYFLENNKGVLIKSDRDGWENLYLHDMNGKLISQVTRGNYWGTSVLSVDQKRKLVYIKARKDNSTRFDIYKVPMNGKSAERLSDGIHSHDIVSMSPHGRYYIAMYSSLTAPPKVKLAGTDGKLVKQLADMKGADFNGYELPRTRITRVKSADGQFDLPLVITYPLNFDSTRKYPVWISIYGGPNAGTVYDRWKPAGGLSQWWAQEGLIQITMDNRSSGHFGKKGMNYIHKQLGKFEIDDYITCAKWIKSQPWADEKKIGITGTSFGGYLTCMALTYGADVFTHGIANSSVTDWKLYDTHYTERFMDQPRDNVEGYRNTSPIIWAKKYKGLLRIVHGTTDDNVHLQNSIQLADRLQDLNRHFELMLYPNQRHGIGGVKSGHNFSETCRFIYRHLLEKEMPDALK